MGHYRPEAILLLTDLGYAGQSPDRGLGGRRRRQIYLPITLVTIRAAKGYWLNFPAPLELRIGEHEEHPRAAFFAIKKQFSPTYSSDPDRTDSPAAWRTWTGGPPGSTSWPS
jgi:hypothetical protein